MRKAILVVLAVIVLTQVPTWLAAGGEKKKKVRVLVPSWPVPVSVPGTLASDLKSGKRITDVEVKPSKGTKSNLSEVIKGKDDKPPTGDYEPLRIQVTKGKSYNTHDCYVSAVLPPGTKLTSFVYKGTFTGTMAGKKHQYTYFEATATTP
jgi:hypothetical protein